jgi:hypothetical protein
VLTSFDRGHSGGARDTADHSRAHRLVSDLLTVGATDTVYRDLYAERARNILAPWLPPEAYRQARAVKATLEAMVRESRARVEKQEWRRVAELAAAIRARRAHMLSADTLELGAQLYDDRAVPLDPFSRVPGLPEAHERNVRDRALSLLATLADHDPGWQDFYIGRRRALETLPLPPSDDSEHTATRDPVKIRSDALVALERADFETLERLAAFALTQAPPTSADSSPAMSIDTGSALGQFPDETVNRARELGLIATVLRPWEDAGSYLQCCCVWRATSPERPVGERPRRIEGCTCGHECPPGVSGVLKETLDLLIAHPFVTSAGARYLPSYAAESVLVEDFAEDAEAFGPSPMLALLGLTQRIGLSRQHIEQVLLERSPAIVRGELALDPREFRLVCIPFDVYSRVGLERGWGKLEGRFTHFDGYQVWREGRLRALAGGDARFGGPHHLFSISSVDERADTIVRFAVVHRGRLASRR